MTESLEDEYSICLTTFEVTSLELYLLIKRVVNNTRYKNVLGPKDVMN